MAQQVGQLGQVLVQPVERAGEQVAEVVGKHFFVGDAGGAAQGLHLAPDVAAVQGRAAAGDEHRAEGDAVLLHIAQKLLLQAGGDEHAAGFALAPHHGYAGAAGLPQGGGQVQRLRRGGGVRDTHRRRLILHQFFIQLDQRIHSLFTAALLAEHHDFALRISL